MSKSHQLDWEEIETRKAIENNLQEIKSVIEDYELTLDYVDFMPETAKLRENLLKLGLKYHILIDGRGSSDLIKATKNEDKEFADQLKTLAKTSRHSDQRMDALTLLNTEIATELMATQRAVGSYKLSDEELAKMARETIERIHTTTEKLKTEIFPEGRKTPPRPSTPAPDLSTVTQVNKPKDKATPTTSTPAPRFERGTIEGKTERRSHVSMGLFKRKPEEAERKSPRKSSDESHSTTPSPRDGKK